MRTRALRAAVGFLALAALAAGCIPDTRPAPEVCAAPSVSLDISIRAGEMSPQNPAVCRGQEVALSVTADEDVVFHIHGYDALATEVAAGVTQAIAFTADRPGQFPVEMHPLDDPATATELGILTVHEP